MLIVLLDALGVLSVRTGHRPGRGADRVGGRPARLVTALVLAVWMVLPMSSASGFGTIDSGGQRREHERVTRAALSCAGDAGSDRTASSRHPSTISRDTTVSSGPSARPTVTSCRIRRRIATTPTSSRAAIRVPATRPRPRWWPA